MSNDLGSAIKSNWYLIVAAVALVIVGVIAGVVSGGEEEGGDVVVQQAGNSIDVVTVEDKPDTPTTTTYQGRSDAEKRAIAIEELEQQLDDDPNAPEAPDRMQTLMTLYVTERDFDSAVAVGEEFVQLYPNHDDVLDTLKTMAQMYEELNESGLARSTYRRIMDHVPPDSAQYTAAQRSIEDLSN